jgi:Na+-transporting methylmalonyl-CoA/oxaloacetate decarboxylase gamma subunit
MTFNEFLMIYGAGVIFNVVVSISFLIYFWYTEIEDIHLSFEAICIALFYILVSWLTLLVVITFFVKEFVSYLNRKCQITIKTRKGKMKSKGNNGVNEDLKDIVNDAVNKNLDFLDSKTDENNEIGFGTDA